jgi:DNA-binding ferritin-like protein
MANDIVRKMGQVSPLPVRPAWLDQGFSEEELAQAPTGGGYRAPYQVPGVGVAEVSRDPKREEGYYPDRESILARMAESWHAQDPVTKAADVVDIGMDFFTGKGPTAVVAKAGAPAIGKLAQAMAMGLTGSTYATKVKKHYAPLLKEVEDQVAAGLRKLGTPEKAIPDLVRKYAPQQQSYMMSKHGQENMLKISEEALSDLKSIGKTPKAQLEQGTRGFFSKKFAKQGWGPFAETPPHEMYHYLINTLHDRSKGKFSKMLTTGGHTAEEIGRQNRLVIALKKASSLEVDHRNVMGHFKDALFTYRNVLPEDVWQKFARKHDEMYWKGIPDELGAKKFAEEMLKEGTDPKMLLKKVTKWATRNAEVVKSLQKDYARIAREMEDEMVKIAQSDYEVGAAAVDFIIEQFGKRQQKSVSGVTDMIEKGMGKGETVPERIKNMAQGINKEMQKKGSVFPSSQAATQRSKAAAKRIAKDLDPRLAHLRVKYVGYQPKIGHQFHDFVTGKNFYSKGMLEGEVERAVSKIRP